MDPLEDQEMVVEIRWAEMDIIITATKEILNLALTGILLVKEVRETISKEDKELQ